jgi:hypothetical protein
VRTTHIRHSAALGYAGSWEGKGEQSLTLPPFISQFIHIVRKPERQKRTFQKGGDSPMDETYKEAVKKLMEQTFRSFDEACENVEQEKLVLLVKFEEVVGFYGSFLPEHMLDRALVNASSALGYLGDDVEVYVLVNTEKRGLEIHPCAKS